MAVTLNLHDLQFILNQIKIAEAHAAGNFVIVNHAERAEPHPLRIMIVGEGESVIAIQPAVVGVTPFVCFSDRHHAYMMPSL